jgi:hypothetical protein
MASELRVDTLKDAAGNNSVGMEYVANGSAKAWVNFNGTGTIATRDSFNVSGLTDNGTGDYTLTTSSAFGTANYSVVSNAQDLSGASNSQVLSLTASTTRLYTITISPLVLADNPQVSVNCHGDLA